MVEIRLKKRYTKRKAEDFIPLPCLAEMVRFKKRYTKRKAEEISGMRLQAMKKAEVFFPDEIVVEILSKLSAENSMRCRLACRRWRDLTSTHAFKELQMRSSIPMIFASTASKSFLLDKWWVPNSSLEYHRFVVGPKDTGQYLSTYYSGKFSHGGLFVFERLPSPEVIILNPTSHRNVKITLSKELKSSEIYGVFFHPLLREYCTLWRLYFGSKVYYKMLNLGCKPCWRDISNPWSRREKFGEMPPVLIGEHLYWRVMSEQHSPRTCEGDIMEFDIRSEKFDLMHCPVPLDVKYAASFDINLLEISGVLSFVLTSRKDGVVNVSIWKLKHRAQQLWLPMNHTIRTEDCLILAVPTAIAVVGEQLVLWSGERLYVCDLELGTIVTFLKERLYLAQPFSHVMSLVSLEHCKSKIFMNKEGEVVEESDMA